MGWSYTKPRGWTTTTTRILTRDGHRCCIGGPECVGVATQVDHIVSVGQGGSHHDDNLRAACGPCHEAKTKAEQAAGRQAKLVQRRRGRAQHPGLLTVAIGSPWGDNPPSHLPGPNGIARLTLATLNSPYARARDLE